MRNKKLILVAILILAIVVLSGCDGLFTLPCVHGVHVDDNNDCICDKCSVQIKHVDGNNDDICDRCGNPMSSTSCQSHVDADSNGLCDICGETVTPICINHDFNGDWQSDESGHWHVCQNTGCNATDTKVDHVATDDGNCITALTCTQCNYVILAGKNGHVDADSDGLCDNENCQKQVVADCETHLLAENWSTDVTNHWQECTVCSYVTEKVAHTPNDVSGDCTLDQVCTVCQHVISQGKAHNFDNGSWCSKENGHWKMCKNCPVEDTENVTSHTPLDTGNADCTKDVTCSVCSFVITKGQTAHDFTGDWQSDKSGHWHVCQNTGCQVADTLQKHADVDTDGICDECEQEVPLECDHADYDSDNVCDVCNESVIVDIDLFGINDLHGKFLASDSQPGVGGLTTYLKNAQQQNDNTIVFSSGDMWQGSAESGLSKGKIMNDWMKELNFAFMTLGNHEYDWGVSYIEQNVSSALPFLGINVYDKSTNQRADYAQPSVLVDLGDVQIGFIGAMGNCLSSISGEWQSQVTFITGSALTNLVKAEATRLRDEGADIIVYSIHSGGEGTYTSDYDEALSSGGYVDIVFEAHTHQSYKVQDSYGVWHLQAGGENTTGLYSVQFDYNLVTDKFTVNTPTLISKDTYGAYDDHSSIQTIKEQNKEALDKCNEVIGINSTTRNSSFIVNLVAQLYAQAGEAKWSSYDIALGGGYLNCRSPYYLYAGEVTYGDLYALLPFDNSIALCSMSGSKLSSLYVNNSKYVNSYTTYGAGITSWSSISTCYFITDSYSYTYSVNQPYTTVIEKYAEGVYARDLVAEYIKNGGLESTTSVQTPTANAYNSIEVLLAYGATLENEVATSDKYYTSGTIKSISSTHYGNMVIVDEDGNELTIYGSYSTDGTTRYGDMTDPPVVGDTINIYGVLVNYNGTIEIKNGWIVDSIPQ